MMFMSLEDLLEERDWDKQDENFYELDISQGETFDDEERIFTHIQKMDIHFKDKPAQMIIIRNISHIIHYEKAKTENKYQELLT